MNTLPSFEPIFEKEDKPLTVILKIPPNLTGDCWLNLLDAFVMRYAEPPLNVDLDDLDRRVRQAQSACLAEYGLHLNV